jgi:hypothetical protein
MNNKIKIKQSIVSRGKNYDDNTIRVHVSKNAKECRLGINHMERVAAAAWVNNPSITLPRKYKSNQRSHSWRRRMDLPKVGLDSLEVLPNYVIKVECTRAVCEEEIERGRIVCGERPIDLNDFPEIR